MLISSFVYASSFPSSRTSCLPFPFNSPPLAPPSSLLMQLIIMFLSFHVFFFFVFCLFPIISFFFLCSSNGFFFLVFFLFLSADSISPLYNLPILFLIVFFFLCPLLPSSPPPPNSYLPFLSPNARPAPPPSPHSSPSPFVSRVMLLLPRKTHYFWGLSRAFEVCKVLSMPRLSCRVFLCPGATLSRKQQQFPVFQFSESSKTALAKRNCLLC